MALCTCCDPMLPPRNRSTFKIMSLVWLVATIVFTVPPLAMSQDQAIATTEATKADDWIMLFDGKSFAGWEGNLQVFRIQDSAIVGGSLDKPVARNEFLCTEKSYENFELQLKVKLIGPGANAGIQFRTRRIPNHHEVSGYQADMGDGWWGKLYDESRRNKVLAQPAAGLAVPPVQADDWNDYRIRCEGNHIQLWLNGIRTVDYRESDETVDHRGVIAVQIHGGPPSEAWYTNIKIRSLD